MDERHPSTRLTSVRSAYGCTELALTVNDNTAFCCKQYKEFLPNH